MKVTTTPVCKVGWPGATLQYVVKAEGANELRLPADSWPGAKVRLLDTRPVGDGIEARLEVKVIDATPY